MERSKIVAVILLSSLMLIPAKAFSNGYTTPWVGGMLSGPGVANGAGIYWDPGSIGEIKGNSLFVTIEPVYEYVSYQKYGVDENGVPFNRVSFHQWAPSPTLAATFELPANFGFGIGIYAPFARFADYPSYGAQRFNGVNVTFMTVNATPVISYRILPSLSIGAGVSYVEGLIDVQESTTINPTDPDDISPINEAKVHLKNDMGSTYGWTVGLYYKPLYNLSVGLSYISRTFYTLDGKADITLSPQVSSLLGVSTITAKSKMIFSMPQMINLGVHFEPTPDWILDVTEQWINWSIFDNIHVKIYDASAQGALVNRELDMVTGFEDTVSSKIWTGYKGFKNWLFAGGVTYDPAGIPMNHIYALNLEFNKMELFAQVNYDVTPNTTIGLGYDHNFIQNDNVMESSVHPPANGLYKGEIEKITLFYNYKF